MEQDRPTISRRSLLASGVLALLAPQVARADGDRGHRPVIEAPHLSEDPTAVPVQVSVDHPMEPDHYIRALEVRLDQDPVPYKGTFLFTPANGEAGVAFHMRSGAGGTLTAVAECSRHGRFSTSRQIRVADGGCTTAPDASSRTGGNPRIRLPRSIRPGEVVQVRIKIDHDSYTGLVVRDGRIVEAAPGFYVKQVLVYFDDQQVSEFQLTSAISANPLLRFPLKAMRSGTLRVVFVNSEEQRWETSERLRL